MTYSPKKNDISLLKDYLKKKQNQDKDLIEFTTENSV